MQSVKLFIEKIVNPFGGPIIYFETVSSTMDMAKCYTQEGTLIITDYQWLGRGRNKGSIWKSISGQNLLFTLILSSKKFTNRPVLLLTALAIIIFLKGYNLYAQIKWPNDILVDGKKIVGILGEVREEKILLGIGININQLYFTNMNSEATSLGSHTHFKIDLRESLIGVLKNLYNVFNNNLNWNRNVNQYLFGKDIFKRYCFSNEENTYYIWGKSFAVQEDGALIILTDSGEFQKLYVLQ